LPPAERTVSLGLAEPPPPERRAAPAAPAAAPVAAPVAAPSTAGEAPPSRLSALLAELDRTPGPTPAAAPSQPSPLQREYTVKAKALRAREYELERSLRALSKYSATSAIIRQ
jgi:hypothetical protein